MTAYLVDTNVLLRLVKPDDCDYPYWYDPLYASSGRPETTFAIHRRIWLSFGILVLARSSGTGMTFQFLKWTGERDL